MEPVEDIMKEIVDMGKRVSRWWASRPWRNSRQHTRGVNRWLLLNQDQMMRKMYKQQYQKTNWHQTIWQKVSDYSSLVLTFYIMDSSMMGHWNRSKWLKNCYYHEEKWGCKKVRQKQRCISIKRHQVSLPVLSPLPPPPPPLPPIRKSTLSPPPPELSQSEANEDENRDDDPLLLNG